MVLRNRSIKRAAIQDDAKPVVTSKITTTAANSGFKKPESITRRKVPNIAVSIRQTLCESNNVVITPPLGQNVENSFTFNSPRARTSTMKRDSLSPSFPNLPELSPIRMPGHCEAISISLGSAEASQEKPKLKDKSSKRKSNLNIAFNEESTG